MDCEECGIIMELDGRDPPLSGLCHPCASAALDEALEVFAPFALHGKALRNADIENVAPLKVISQVGVSALVGGAFSSAIEFFEKYGIRKNVCLECGSERPRIDCPSCGNGAVGS